MTPSRWRERDAGKCSCGMSDCFQQEHQEGTFDEQVAMPSLSVSSPTQVFWFGANALFDLLMPVLNCVCVCVKWKNDSYFVSKYKDMQCFPHCGKEFLSSSFPLLRSSQFTSMDWLGVLDGQGFYIFFRLSSQTPCTELVLSSYISKSKIFKNMWVYWRDFFLCKQKETHLG